MDTVLVVEDEKDISELLKYNLEREGYRTVAAGSGEECLRLVKTTAPQLIILDLMLPGMQGLDVLRQIKAHEKTSSIPVIILSAKSAETDRILGLEIGADDYVSKPFSVKELLSRVKAVIRRAAPRKASNTFSYKGLEIDFDSVSVKIHGEEIHLSPFEFKILAFLVQNPGKAFSRDELLDNVWRDDAFVQPRTVDVHVRRIRTLTEKNPKNPVFIKTVRGFGYIFKPGS